MEPRDGFFQAGRNNRVCGSLVRLGPEVGGDVNRHKQKDGPEYKTKTAERRGEVLEKQPDRKELEGFVEHFWESVLQLI